MRGLYCKQHNCHPAPYYLNRDKPFLTLNNRYHSPERDSNLGPSVATISWEIACCLKLLGHHSRFFHHFSSLEIFFILMTAFKIHKKLQFWSYLSWTCCALVLHQICPASFLSIILHQLSLAPLHRSSSYLLVKQENISSKYNLEKH